MIKRNMRLITMLMTAASIMSTVEAEACTRLVAKEGNIEQAAAFKSGKYLYQGYKDDQDDGMYFYDGKDDLLLEDLSSFDENFKDGRNYVWVKDDDDNDYKINMENIEQANTYDRGYDEETIQTRLKTILKKTSRYGKDVEIESFNRIDDSIFGDKTPWYSYTAYGNEKKYDNIIERVEEDNKPENNKNIKTEVKITIKAFYANITIGNQTFEPKWGLNLSEELAKSIKSADFEDFVVLSVDVDSTDPGGDKVIAVLGSETQFDSLPQGFLKFDGNDATWEMNAEISQRQPGAPQQPEMPSMQSPSGEGPINDEYMDDTIGESNDTGDNLLSDLKDKVINDNEIEDEEITEEIDSSEDDYREAVDEENEINDEEAEESDLDEEDKEILESYVNESLQSKDDESSTVPLYFGYINQNGIYMDCSQTANLKIYNGEKLVTIDKFNSRKTVNGKTVAVGTPKLMMTLGQDSGNIYAVIKVPVIGYQKVNGGKSAPLAVTELSFVQKISKVVGEEKDGVYLPMKVESYMLNNDATWTGGDNWSYLASFYALDGTDSERKIKIVNDDIVVAKPVVSDGENSVEVSFIKLGNTKRITPVKIGEDGREVVDKSKKEVQIPLVYKDTGDTIAINDSNSWTMDSIGNIFAIKDGVIRVSESGSEFYEYYKCDEDMNKIDAYDLNNFIVWSDKEDIYSTNRECEGLALDSSYIKSGWLKDEDGIYRLYNADGKMVTGWYAQKSGWYFMNNDGIMQTGWLKDKENWYYLSDTGIMKTGWFKDADNKWYYLNKDGSMAKDTIIDGYKIGNDGTLI